MGNQVFSSSWNSTLLTAVAGSTRRICRLLASMTRRSPFSARSIAPGSGMVGELKEKKGIASPVTGSIRSIQSSAVSETYSSPSGETATPRGLKTSEPLAIVVTVPLEGSR
jgi:hypothetical protein